MNMEELLLRAAPSLTFNVGQFWSGTIVAVKRQGHLPNLTIKTEIPFESGYGKLILTQWPLVKELVAAMAEAKVEQITIGDYIRVGFHGPGLWEIDYQRMSGSFDA